MAPVSSGTPPPAATPREWLSDFGFTLERSGSAYESAPVLDHFGSVPMDFEPR
jgi:hypothetical protein